MASEENTVWHYTKMDVLEKMFPQKGNEEHNKEKIRIRFVSTRFKNDPSEGLFLKEILKKYKQELKLNELKDFEGNLIDFDKQIEDIEEDLGRCYIFSTTSSENSMVFWNKGYAGTDGIAIGFDKNYEENNIADWDFISELKYYLIRYKLFENVIYVPNPKTESINKQVLSDIKKYLDDYYNKEKEEYNKSTSLYKYYYFNWLKNFVVNFSSIYKHESWKDEKESRIMLLNTFEASEEHGVLQSKVECIGNKLIKTCYKNINKKFCKKIMLGPDCKQEYKKYVEKYLKDNDYDIKVLENNAFSLRYRLSESKELSNMLEPRFFKNLDGYSAV